MVTELGRRLTQIREDAGLTQTALARLSETSQSAISQIESGERNPSYELITKIAAALNVKPGYLIGGQVEGLSPEEETIFRLYRGLPEEGRSELRQFAMYLRQKYPAG